MCIFWIAAVDDVEKGALDFFGDWPPAAAADLDAVELANRRDLRRRAGKESFVGNIDFVAGDAFFHHFQPQVFGNVEDRVARDAVECTGGQIGRVDDATPDDENIFTRPFRDK